MRLVNKIRAYALYQDNWDGYGAKPASHKAVVEAETFVRSLPLKEIYAPAISLAGDGEINFLWDETDISIDLGFYGRGVYSYYVVIKKTGQEFFGDDITIPAQLLPEWLELLKR